MNFTSETTERLDKFLAGKIPDVSRARIQKAIKDGLVLVNGKQILETDFQLKTEDKVELPEFKQEKLEPSNLELKVIFENQDLAVIDKPAGLMVHPAAGRSGDTLAHALLTRFPGIEKVGEPHRPGIVHRLDEDTSGLLLVAKSQKGYDFLKNLFEIRNIEKEYLALVHGVPKQLHGIIDEPIGKTTTHTKMRVGVGREAKTEYKVLANDPALQYSLLLVKLHTGRTHQIRVHMSHIGHSVLGDKIYGREYKQSDKSLINRQFLHAFKLKFKSIDGTWMEFESELSKDLKEVLKKLEINFPS